MISFTNFVDLGLTGRQVLNRNIRIYWSTGRHVLIHKFEVDLFQQLYYTRSTGRQVLNISSRSTGRQVSTIVFH